jgi:hypothetical protein
MNGQECAEQNFQAWAASKTDGDFREMVRQNQLNRGEICRECSLGRAALRQNPRIKEALTELEAQLRVRGVLAEPAHIIRAAPGDGLGDRAARHGVLSCAPPAT